MNKENTLLKRLTRPHYIKTELGDYIYIEGGRLKSKNPLYGESTIILNSELNEKKDGKFLFGKTNFIKGNKIVYDIDENDIVISLKHHSDRLSGKKRYYLSISIVKFIEDQKYKTYKPYFKEFATMYGLYSDKTSLINKITKRFPKTFKKIKSKEEIRKIIEKIVKYAFTYPVILNKGEDNG